MRLVHWSALLVVPLVLFACDVPTAPTLPDGAQRFEPPPAYRLWWSMTQECSGRVGSFAAVDWYVVPGSTALTVDGKRVDGYWTSPGNTIVLSESAVMDGALVRHEMLHSLSRAPGHPRDYFLGRCGGVVVCIMTCLKDAGPLPPADAAAVHVAPSALEVGVAVSPESPSRSSYGGFFTMAITVRNPLDHPVIVNLPPSTNAGPGVSFEHRVAGNGLTWTYDDPVLDDGVIRFAAGETKRRVFDFHALGAVGASPSDGLRSGAYEFRGGYGRNWAVNTATVTLP